MRPTMSNVLQRSSAGSILAAVQLDPTPATKVLEVMSSSAFEVIVCLAVLRLCAICIARCYNARTRAVLSLASWLIIIQGSQRLQGIVQSSKEVLSPVWYATLRKPVWNPPPWVFPVVWIPLKVMQVFSASRLWARLEYRTATAPAIILFVLHLALGDVWNRQFFIKQRLLTGLLVIGCFWIVLTASALLFAATSAFSAALLVPSIVWVAIASALNLDVWWLNR